MDPKPAGRFGRKVTQMIMGMHSVLGSCRGGLVRDKFPTATSVRSEALRSTFHLANLKFILVSRMNSKDTNEDVLQWRFGIGMDV